LINRKNPEIVGYDYYNDGKAYEAGLEALETANKSAITNDLRIFPVYQNISKDQPYLDKVIIKTSAILKAHPKSDLADNALLLMGKAYFYKQEFEPAERKFQEILTNYFEGDARDEASFWYGRTLARQLETQKALEILQSVVLSKNTQSNIRSKAYFLLAELHISNSDYDRATTSITRGIKLGEDTYLNTRAGFTLARLYERLEKYELAAKTFEYVLNSGPEYDLRLEANLKYAIIQRENGNFEKAREIFNDLLSDDKNIDRFATIRYELATTYAKSGDLPEAIDLYFEIIKRHPKTEASAKSFFQLAKLRETIFSDYNAAAALYDSARAEYKTGSVYALSNRSLGLMTDILRLRESITQLDSVLSLGIVEQSKQTNLVVSSKKELSKPSPDFNIESILAQRTRKDYRKSAFLARGGRDVFKTSTESNTGSVAKIRYQSAGDSTTLMAYKLEYLEKQVQLGQLFHLKLSKPDSAETHYKNALQTSKTDQLIVSDSLKKNQRALEKAALFSLADVYRLTRNKKKRDSVLTVLLDQYPKSPYIHKVRSQRNLPALATKEDTILNNYESALKLWERGKTEASLDQLKRLTQKAAWHPLAPKLFMSIGHIYEYGLSNADSALHYYTQLKTLYPNAIETEKIIPKLAYVKALNDTAITASDNKPEEPNSNRPSKKEIKPKD
jgi:TolA-binding protein